MYFRESHRRLTRPLAAMASPHVHGIENRRLSAIKITVGVISSQHSPAPSGGTGGLYAGMGKGERNEGVWLRSGLWDGKGRFRQIAAQKFDLICRRSELCDGIDGTGRARDAVFHFWRHRSASDRRPITPSRINPLMARSRAPIWTAGTSNGVR